MQNKLVEQRHETCEREEMEGDKWQEGEDPCIQISFLYVRPVPFYAIRVSTFLYISVSSKAYITCCSILY